ncbi:MAG TPA: SBBP repeat-containing protein [Bacteroidia bacterium]|nr:SBBP repeat-containing protein [Bacteroidia bacterium]
MKKITTLFTTLLFVAAVVLSNQAKAQSSCAWAKKAGGTFEDGGNAVATDVSGNVYALGYYYSTTITFSTTTLHNVYGAGPYMYLAKYDSCGNLLWAKQAGGNGGTNPNGLATDAAGNVYVTGYYNADTLNFGGTVKLINTSGYTAFVAKYNSSGVAQWAQQGTGNAASRAYSVAVDASNNVYITGYFSSTSIAFGINNAINGTNDGVTNDVFIAKFDNNGNSLWVKGSTSNSTTSGDALGYGIGADAAGNVYVTGSFESSNITFGGTTLANNGYIDMFVVKYNTSGTFQWLKTAGSTDNDAAFSLASDAAGNVYITGNIGASSTVSFGTHSVTNNTNSLEAFIAKYDANGNDLWAQCTQGDGFSNNNGNSIALDAGGNAYITGTYSSDSLHVGPVTLFNASFLNGSGGGDFENDVFVAKYKSNGILSWARTAGGDSVDVGNGIATGPHGALYITGEYRSPSISFNGIVLTSVNSYGDAFIVNNMATLPVTPNICLVSDDSIGVNEYNYVYWDKTAYPTASTFIIYREVASGIYKEIGSQPYNALSQFMDTVRSVGPANGDPMVSTYRYKLQFMDTSGAYSFMSPYHNTVYFVGNGSGTFTWNTYAVENMTLTPVSSVDLERDDFSTGAWHTVSSGSGTQTNITDPNYSTYATTGDWRVSSNGFNCTPTLRLNGNNSTMAAKVKSHSNQNNNRMSGIKSLSNASQVNIYPNPNKGNFTIETTATEKQTVQVFDVNGKLVFSQTINGNINVDASNLAEGVYNVSIMGNEGVVNKRLVIVK